MLFVCAPRLRLRSHSCSRPVRPCKRIRARIRSAPPGAIISTLFCRLCPYVLPAPHSCFPSLARPCDPSCPPSDRRRRVRSSRRCFTFVPTSAPAFVRPFVPAIDQCPGSRPASIPTLAFVSCVSVAPTLVCSSPSRRVPSRLRTHRVVHRLLPRLRPVIIPSSFMSCFYVPTCRRMYVRRHRVVFRRILPCFRMSANFGCFDNRFRPCLPCSSACAFCCVMPAPALPPIC